MKRFEGDITKLPKWAQRDIQRLESDLRHTKQELREMQAHDGAPTEVFIWKGTDMVPLPRRTQIRFLVRAGEEHGPSFDVSIRDGRLRIYGSRWYAIHPSASNTIDIKIEED